MDFQNIYNGKLKSADEAVAAIPSGSKMAMGMAMAEPPALLRALANRARAGGVEALKLYYFEATSIAGDTVLAYDLVDRIEPYCMFMTKADRNTIKRGLEEDRKVLRYVPNTFHQAPRLMIEEDRHRVIRLRRLADGQARLHDLRRRQRLFVQGRARGQAADRRG